MSETTFKVGDWVRIKDDVWPSSLCCGDEPGDVGQIINFDGCPDGCGNDIQVRTAVRKNEHFFSADELEHVDASDYELA